MFERRYRSLKYAQVDIEEISEVRTFVDVYAVPSFYCFSDGKLVSYMIGGNASKLDEFLHRHAVI